MVPAVVDVLERRNVAKKAKVEGAWERFLDQVEAWDGQLVVASQEFLSGATAERGEGGRRHLRRAAGQGRHDLP